ncbi:MarR family winged helix-turn-helix transcriptional regulator [Kitasatospora sp. LaBMicrA B282]|uniref:MarR family winged helix-turn-helix transcriptional regulator n=1 Tax=Kitasatospora sp. LaBMicrA B282 TaxID=3420949 RepID=UPI003D138661
MAEHGSDDLAQDTTEVITAVMAASRLFVALSARALADTESSLSVPQLRTLVVLRNLGSAKLAVLAQALGVNPSSAMRSVDRLEAMGLVDRQVNADNRREVVLSLTAEGRRLVDRVLEDRHREVAKIVSRLSPDRRAALVEALTALTAAADVPAVDPLTDVPFVP